MSGSAACSSHRPARGCPEGRRTVGRYPRRVRARRAVATWVAQAYGERGTARRRVTAVHGDGNGWVVCAEGHRHWGRHGAAGLLLRRRVEDRVEALMQHRAPWTASGDTGACPVAPGTATSRPGRRRCARPARRQGSPLPRCGSWTSCRTTTAAGATSPWSPTRWSGSRSWPTRRAWTCAGSPRRRSSCWTCTPASPAPGRGCARSAGAEALGARPARSAQPPRSAVPSRGMPLMPRGPGRTASTWFTPIRFALECQRRPRDVEPPHPGPAGRG